MLNRLKSLLPNRSQPAEASVARKKEGDEHLKAGRVNDAVACYRSAVEMAPAYGDALVGLGFALSELKEYTEAENYLRRALAIEHDMADVHYILGTIAKERGEDATAGAHFASAIDAKPDFEFAHRALYAVLIHGGQPERAKEALQRAIAGCPESAELLSCLGTVLTQEGALDEAVECYRKALSISPNAAEVHAHLADTLATADKLDEAVTSYQKAIWFAPDFTAAHLALGSLRTRQNFPDQAIKCYERAIELDPRNAAAQMALGRALESAGRREDAIARFRRAVEIAPDLPTTHHHLGNALNAHGATEEAVACFEEVVRLDPASPLGHLVAALSGRGSDRAPSAYVAQLFDEYAQKFDAHLVDVLKYTVPAKLAELLRPCAQGDGPWSIVDLGCGTGLSGAAIAEFAKQLVGVDLSEKMLDKARERNIYHRLEQLDLLTMMRRESASTYDVVFSADVFVYLGALDDLVSEAHRLLRPGGYVAFSVESLEALGSNTNSSSQDYRLNPTGRYAHSIDYLRRMAAHNGFAILSTTETQSRLDNGVPVVGYLSLWRKPLD